MLSWDTLIEAAIIEVIESLHKNNTIRELGIPAKLFTAEDIYIA